MPAASCRRNASKQSGAERDITVPGKSSVYEEDFMRWAEAQAKGLRRAAEAGSNLPLDWYNLAEEIESLGRSQRRELWREHRRASPEAAVLPGDGAARGMDR